MEYLTPACAAKLITVSNFCLKKSDDSQQQNHFCCRSPSQKHSFEYCLIAKAYKLKGSRSCMYAQHSTGAQTHRCTQCRDTHTHSVTLTKLWITAKRSSLIAFESFPHTIADVALRNDSSPCAMVKNSTIVHSLKYF
jgi:hypothetical protein